MEYREEILEKEVESGKKRGEEWKNLKIKKTTYKQITRLSRVLGIKKYKVVNLSTMILSLLLSEKIIINQEDVDKSLIECKIKYGYNEKSGYGWVELDPVCVIKKLVLQYYMRKKILENLIENIDKLSKI